MTTKMIMNGTTRKALVAAIAEITGEKAIYRAMPAFSYDVGEITVTKDGSIVCPNGTDILTALAATEFFQEEAETVTEAEESTGLTVSLPEDGFTEASLDNLRKLVDARPALSRNRWVRTGWTLRSKTARCPSLGETGCRSRRRPRLRVRSTHSDASSCGWVSSATTAKQRGRFCTATFPATPLSAL